MKEYLFIVGALCIIGFGLWKLQETFQLDIKYGHGKCRDDCKLKCDEEFIKKIRKDKENE